jgi:hypothetical protein
MIGWVVRADRQHAQPWTNLADVNEVTGCPRERYMVSPAARIDEQR